LYALKSTNPTLDVNKCLQLASELEMGNTLLSRQTDHLTKAIKIAKTVLQSKLKMS
jgi:hypothetical protein